MRLMSIANDRTNAIIIGINMNYDKLVKRATIFAVISAIFLLIIKLVAWWLTNSMTILASLFDSSIDLLASGANLIILRYALQPADRGHTFGHGKAEPLAALAQSAFIAGSAVFLLLNSVKSFISPEPLHFPIAGISISIVSIVFTLALNSYQQYVIRHTGSQAIQADMLHYKSDLLMNIAVLIALLLSWNGLIYADGIFAFLISLYILYSAFQIAYNAIQSLLDKALPDEEIKQIHDIVCQSPHVHGVHGIRTRQSGKTKFIQLHLELPDNLPLIDAHSIADQVEATLAQAFPNSDIIIHQDPCSVVAHELSTKSEISPPNILP